MRNKSDSDLSTMSSFESQRKPLVGLMSERQALLHKLDINKRRGGLRVFIANVQGGTKLWSPRPNREVMRLSEPYQ